MSDINFDRDKQFSDRFVPEAKAILGLVLFVDAPDFEDRHHNADLILDTKDRDQLQISLRTRHHSFIKQFGNEFTLCFDRGQGGLAEYQKIVGATPDGKTWGTHILYDFEDRSGNHIEKWFVGDFDVFRKYVPYIQYNYNNNTIWMNGKRIGTIVSVPRTDSLSQKEYHDRMYAFDRDAFPGFVIAKSEDYPFWLRAVKPNDGTLYNINENRGIVS